jgi:hypothetical protein
LDSLFAYHESTGSRTGAIINNRWLAFDILVGAIVGFVSSFGLEQAKTWFKRRRDEDELRTGLYRSLGTVLAELDAAIARIPKHSDEDKLGIMTAGPNNLAFAKRQFDTYLSAFPLTFVSLPEAEAMELLFRAIADASNVTPGTKEEALQQSTRLRSDIHFFIREGVLDNARIEPVYPRCCKP